MSEEKTEVKLHTFRVHILKNRFILTKDRSFSDVRNVDWNAETSKELTEKLNQQIENSIVNLDLLQGLCNEDLELFSLVNVSDKDALTIDFPLSKEKRKELCEKFRIQIDSYIEVFSRDEEALKQEGFNVQIYCTVLIQNNTYLGHIYCWMSPKNKSYCLAMGIRSRVDTVFLRERNKLLPNISYYLLEGVRRFALIKGADKIAITYPLSNMVRILTFLGFERKTLFDIIGKSISPLPILCTECYIRDVKKPIIEANIKYLLTD